MNSTIVDDRIKPYFIKLVNSTYEVHKNHTPKDSSKQPYTKLEFISSSIRGALVGIAKRKLSFKREQKRVYQLDVFLKELREQRTAIESLMDDIDDGSLERRFILLQRDFNALRKRIEQLESKSKKEDSMNKEFSLQL